jgi:hypothetical protein
MPVRKAFEIMDRDLGTAFDPDCVAGLKEIYGHREEMEVAVAA